MALHLQAPLQLRYWVLVAAGLALQASSALAQPECELNGESINTNNGAAMEGKSGTLRCRRDGVVVREQEVKNGKE